jgi:hypothetical protein
VEKGVWKLRSVGIRLIILGLLVGAHFCRADESAAKLAAATPNEAGLYVKVRLARSLKLSKLKAGQVVEGTLSRDVYSADRKLFSAGSPVRLSVDHMEKRKSTPNDHWPWVVKAFTPRHENYPVFKQALVRENGLESSLSVSATFASRVRDVHAKAKKDPSARSEHDAVDTGNPKSTKPPTPTIVLEAELPAGEINTSADSNTAFDSDASLPATIPAGTRCKIVLLGTVSASKAKSGDTVAARLLEPVLLDSRVALPAGSYFKGRILKSTPPRWLSRSGSLYMDFTEVSLPNGKAMKVAASLAGAELDAGSHTRMDAEGRLRGERPGKAWMAINLGVTTGIAKGVDDGMQLVIEALISTATDVSTAGTARLISSGASALYMATRHGRDVILPRFTELDISFDRPVSLNTTDAPQIAAANSTEERNDR